MYDKTLILSRKEVEKLINFKDTIAAVAEAYKAFSSRKVIQPPIVSIDIKEHNGELDIKSGCDLRQNTIGVKMASGFWDNPKKGLPSMYGIITLFDAETSYPLCILDGGLITYYRTAAAGAYASTLLARKDSRNLCLIGSGGLARMQLLAHMEVFKLKSVKIFSADRDQCLALASEMQGKYQDTFFAVCSTAREAAKDADIIVTATSSREPILMDADIPEGCHINAFGCDMKGKQELDPEIFRRASVVLDCPEECFHRGETQHAYGAGIINENNFAAEIGEIALGLKNVRTCDKQITIFDSTGMSVQDISTSLGLYRKALELGVGTAVELA